MQSVCTLLPDEFAARVVEAVLSDEPSIGEIYDPPFAHFTLQLAEDYDWEGLAAAMASFAAKEEPFEAQTSGLLIMGDGKTSGVLVGPYPSSQLRDFQARLWQAIEGFAKGNIRKMDYPGAWLPHVTIKRCGSDHADTGRGITRLLEQEFAWTFLVDNVAVQHDPGQNSRTHYLRLRFPLGGGKAAVFEPPTTNATISDVRQSKDANGAPLTVATVRLDEGGEMEQAWTAPQIVRVMASLKCSDVHFPGSRCYVESGKITAVAPQTPHPLLR